MKEKEGRDQLIHRQNTHWRPLHSHLTVLLISRWTLYVQKGIPLSASRLKSASRGGTPAHEPLPSLPKLSLATVCPQTSIIGGFCGVASVLETGHAKIE